MYCRKCGKPIEDNAVFCRYCGFQLSPQPVPVQWQDTPSPNAAAEVSAPRRRRRTEQPVHQAVQQAAEPLQQAFRQATEPVQQMIQQAAQPLQKSAQQAAQPVVNVVRQAAESVPAVSLFASAQGGELSLGEFGSDVLQSVPGLNEIRQQAEEILSPFKTLLSGIRSFTGNLSGLLKNKKALLFTALMAVV